MRLHLGTSSPQSPGKLAHLAALPLRLVVGYGFMAHGYAKLARGPEHLISILGTLGVPAPALMGWLTIGTELIGGFALLVGAFVAFVSAPLGVILLVAALTVHLQYGFSSIKLQAVTAAGAQFGQPGYELDLLYLACLLTLVLGGSGPLAIDNLFRRGKSASSLGTRQT
jgi:putative oxidoreductase